MQILIGVSGICSKFPIDIGSVVASYFGAPSPASFVKFNLTIKRWMNHKSSSFNEGTLARIEPCGQLDAMSKVLCSLKPSTVFIIVSKIKVFCTFLGLGDGAPYGWAITDWSDRRACLPINHSLTFG